ncbi:hypothetical protein A3K86_14370 [Photobacterium jeanii]|uniref:Pirin n=2 Tax=Photobacterium jeanii TaxID=858640 RepID=A0A178K9Q2_9GAMM|nr:hypothetical protein A3K86_14370 [Photobacterium jeanii]PST88915.1 hypothetical protein C9I91_16235 [Photobacterium jeanii]
MTAYIQQESINELNPFALWDHYRAKDLTRAVGLDFHGHSGVNTLSYPVCGQMRHVDSTGCQTMLRAGDVQMMLAGNGVVHKDTLKPINGIVETFALWTLLPTAKDEMTQASSQKYAADDLPLLEESNATTKVLIGKCRNVKSPISSPSPILVLDIAIAPYGSWQMQPDDNLTAGFVFVHSGNAFLSGVHIHNDQMGIFQPSSEAIEIRTNQSGCRVILAIGQPLKQNIIASPTSVHSSKNNQQQANQHIEQLMKVVKH